MGASGRAKSPTSLHPCMVAWGLAASATLAMAAAGFYLALGLHILRRPVEAEFAWANAAFGSGWVGLGAMVATDGARLLTGMTGAPDPALYLTLVELKIIATAFAITSFLTYVLFLYTGRAAAALVPSLILGLAYTFFFLAITLARLPLEIHVGTWATRLQLQPGSSVPGGDAVGIVLFFLPLLATTFLYLLLWRRVPTRTQHWRIIAVGVSLVVFQLAASIQSNPAVSPDSLLLPFALSVMLATGVFSFWSFRPPGWLRSRFGIHDLDREPAPRPLGEP